MVGLVKGVAEATASVPKLVSGRLVDRGAGAKRLGFAGYGLANLPRPAIGLAALWPVALLLRFADRVGKGIRTAPRDALIGLATLVTALAAAGMALAARAARPASA